MASAFDKFDIQYVSQKSVKGSIITDHLASVLISDGRIVNDDFSDEEIVAMTSLSNWCMNFDDVANHCGYGIGPLFVFPHIDHILKFVCLAFFDRHPTMNNIVEYKAFILILETTLELRIRQIELFSDSNLVLK